MTELPKAYEPEAVEKKWQSKWVEGQCFHANPDSTKEAYSIVIPPPNVTGVLHMGHVLNNTIQDILVRRARQEGKEVLWLPGTDHAGIATQARVERELAKEDPPRTRHDVGRSAFLDMVWEWKEKHGGIIIEQLKRLGCSCDWERERFTMDDHFAPEVLNTFVDLFNKGFIYRGYRMVNWDPVLLTALSDEEVIMTPASGKFYTVRYLLSDGSGELHVSTTRPETIMADVAVAVHPDDPRFAHLIGKTVRRPLYDGDIPIIADEGVEIEFGTGALKITPAHDKTDFEIGTKNGLEFISVIDAQGNIDCPGLPELHGKERFVARALAADLLEAKGLMVKQEPYENNVGMSERSGVPIEPRLSMQWFLKYPCVKEATEALENGEITFRPARWAKTYAHWMHGIQDWCISRQLWWGHRIPVWYRKEKAQQLQEATKLDEQDAAAGDLYVGVEPPADAENWVQDEDALDTWFSSWIWPYATMDEACRAKFYPTSDLVTGPDILFFWVARMIMAAYHFTGEKPFSHVFFTAIVRDLQGRKMSKSLGNSPDPLDLIAHYGADGLRFGLMRIAPTGSDIKFDEKQIEEGKNFANKIYNAVRFRLMQSDVAAGVTPEYSAVHLDILAKLKLLHEQVATALKKYEFNTYTQALYSFFWNEYCALFLEAVKNDLRGDEYSGLRKATLLTMDTVLRHYLALLAPIMPHLAEELWVSLGYGVQNEGDVLMLTLLPSPDELLTDVSASQLETSITLASQIYETANRARNLKAEYNLASNKNVSFILKAAQTQDEDTLQRLALLIGARSVEQNEDYVAEKGTPTALSELGELFMPLEGLVDLEAENKRLKKELEKILSEMAKSQAKLDNPGFADRAPAAIVAQERARLQEWTAKQQQLLAMLSALQ